MPTKQTIKRYKKEVNDLFQERFGIVNNINLSEERLLIAKREKKANGKKIHTRINVLASGLTTKEQRVLELRYGIDGEWRTLGECARVLDVTRERIRQLEAKAWIRILGNEYYCYHCWGVCRKGGNHHK